MKQRGFAIVEILIGLGLSLFVFVAAFEFLGITRDLFGKLRDVETEAQAAAAALDKIRIDLQRAGQGLVGPLRSSTVTGIEIAGPGIAVAVAEKEYALNQDLLPGYTRVALTSTSGLSPQRPVCLVDSGWSESHTILSVESSAVVLIEPLQAAFSRTRGRLCLIEKITYYLDQPSGILRRKVNASPAQPLLEDVAAFAFSYDASANLARAGFSLQNSKEKRYEIAVFPKNIGLARPLQ